MKKMLESHESEGDTEDISRQVTSGFFIAIN